MEILNWVENWYSNQCDGEWEHAYGITISTIDNPGWTVEIDLKDTELQGYQKDYHLVEISENDWYGISVKDDLFRASGDEKKLHFLLEKFRELVEST